MIPKIIVFILIRFNNFILNHLLFKGLIYAMKVSTAVNHY